MSDGAARPPTGYPILPAKIATDEIAARPGGYSTEVVLLP